ncbi:sensor histidine kinase [Paenibacillus zanthoxyli]|uniref:sensor histidine kinase n=1 Tax=Paenibacillus zanthoxyli TaxID=369399 RepID=UPI0004727421|nr:HAMP domain-containing sensor histidine kinase [Paenibacillus zanthoxyli]
MLLLWFALWVMAALLYFSDRHNEKNRWGSLLSFLCGCGGLGVVVHEDIYRYFQSPYLYFFYTLLSSLAYFVSPYVLMIFSIVEYGFAHRKIFKFILLLPVLIMYIIYPLYPKYQPDYAVLSVWVVPYVLSANMILIYSYWKEKNFIVKRQKIYIILVILPTTFFAMSANYIFQSIGIDRLWEFNVLTISIGFITFLYFSLRFGFLGVRLRLERQRFDISIKAASSGTAILNHTIKNELGKINLLANELIRCEYPEAPEIYRRNMDLIQQSSQHVLEIAKRIHYRLNVMEFKESVFRLIDIIENSLNLLSHGLESVQIEKQYNTDLLILGDPVHLQETIINCIKNAIEAMDRKNGKLILKLYEARKQVYIEITDNGKGIETEKIPYVLDPFYSTKLTDGNYGLGLTYCYSVIQKHGGVLTLRSKINQGTTVTLSLPTKRVQSSKTQSTTEVSYGPLD